jgi:hypothetical protein
LVVVFTTGSFFSGTFFLNLVEGRVGEVLDLVLESASLKGLFFIPPLPPPDPPEGLDLKEEEEEEGILDLDLSSAALKGLLFTDPPEEEEGKKLEGEGDEEVVAFSSVFLKMLFFTDPVEEGEGEEEGEEGDLVMELPPEGMEEGSFKVVVLVEGEKEGEVLERVLLSTVLNGLLFTPPVDEERGEVLAGVAGPPVEEEGFEAPEYAPEEEGERKAAEGAEEGGLNPPAWLLPIGVEVLGIVGDLAELGALEGGGPALYLHEIKNEGGLTLCLFSTTDLAQGWQ